MEDVVTISSPRIESRSASRTSDLSDLLSRIEELIAHARRYEQRWEREIRSVHPAFRSSALNLVHYLAVRQFDLRELQERLARFGLSSLGRIEAHVVPSLEAVQRILERVSSRSRAHAALVPADFDESAQLLAEHTESLFGAAPEGRPVRIMVTLPTEAADQYGFVHSLMLAGMDCARINCAHGDESTWRMMIENVRRAERETGRGCRILMDLAGVKPRTGPIESGPEVISWKPEKDLLGRVIAPARLWLAPPGCLPPESLQVSAALPVDELWLKSVDPAGKIYFRDARGKKRRLRVVEKYDGGVIAETYRSAYVTSGTILTIHAKDDDGSVEKRKVPIGRLSPLDLPIYLTTGELLMLLRNPVVGRGAVPSKKHEPDSPAMISCTVPEILSQVKQGDVVKFDDGKIDGVVRDVSDEGLTVEITRASNGGGKLRSNRSINFPESALDFGGLAAGDLADLGFVSRYADIVGLSFVNSVNDVRGLQDEMAETTAVSKAIVLKVETQRGFKQLPLLILEAMRSYPIGVMIARGDLAVECGWERTAEVQEEILWLCEAAHVPVIWATQVLESLTKKGLPSRAEITDAAMSERAECVMLNKGPYILDAIRTLDNVLQRMQGHQSKKKTLLRNLRVTDIAAEN